MRKEAAGLMRKLATSVQQSHPDMNVHDHLRDAAKQVEKGNEEASQRHLRAAMFSLTPQSLMRNGLHTDDAHQAGRQVMHGIHRHLLLVKDIADADAKNQAVIRRDSGDGAAVPPLRPDPNAGYGPGANAQKPTVRQPPGDQALNAPAKADGGGSDPAVADPNSPQRPGSKQFTTRNGVRAVTELAYGWGDLGTLIEFSAKTAALEVTPAPRGKPGGPGLYKAKGNMHSPYMQNLVKALIEKRGMDPGKAYAIAWSSMRKLSATSKHPEVRAASAGGLGLEKVAEARAHAHANRHGRVIDLDWTAWDAGQRGDASAKAHDTASATASRDAKAKIAADKLHSVADDADKKFPSASAGKDIHAAADSFSKGDAEGAHQHLQDARMKVRGASEAKGKIVGRDPIANDQNDLDSVLRTGQGQAQMMAQQQDDDAKAAAKAAKKAAKAQQHAVTWDDVLRVVELAATATQARVPAGQAGGGRFGSGGGQPDAHQLHVAHVANVAAKQQQGQQKSAASATAGKTAAASAKAKIAASQQSKARLMQQAAGYRAKADALITQRKALQAQLASASGAVSSGQSGSTTSSGASTTSSGASTTASTAPAAGTTAAAATPATAASTTTTPAASTTALTAAQSAQIKVQVAQMTTQIIELQGQYAQAMAAAAKL
jgi:hypothetical protein